MEGDQTPRALPELLRMQLTVIPALSISKPARRVFFFFLIVFLLLAAKSSGKKKKKS